MRFLISLKLFYSQLFNFSAIFRSYFPLSTHTPHAFRFQAASRRLSGLCCGVTVPIGARVEVILITIKMLATIVRSKQDIFI